MTLTVNQLRKVREVYRLTLDEMAALGDISGSHLCRIEKGERPLKKRIAMKVIDELELTPKKLDRILEIYEEFQYKE